MRCAGETTVPCSFLRSAALTLRSLLQIPAFCLSAQGITARLAAFLHTPTLCADRRTERQARLAAGCVCLTLLQHSNILNRLLLPFFHFSPPAPCWHKMINYDLLLLGRSCADCSRADWRSACRPACRPVCCCICMQLQPVATICSQSRVKSSNRILFSLIFSALSQFFPARDARISWLFSAFCSNNVLEQ